MKLEHAAAAAVVVGVLLIGASFVWPYAATQGPGGWTDEQAQRHAQTRAELHSATHAHPHPHGSASNHHGESAARVAELQARFEAELAELESVRNRSETGARVLWWAGAALAVGGAAFYFLSRAT